MKQVYPCLTTVWSRKRKVLTQKSKLGHDLFLSGIYLFPVLQNIYSSLPFTKEEKIYLFQRHVLPTPFLSQNSWCDIFQVIAHNFDRRVIYLPTMCILVNLFITYLCTFLCYCLKQLWLTSSPMGIPIKWVIIFFASAILKIEKCISLKVGVSNATKDLSYVEKYVPSGMKWNRGNLGFFWHFFLIHTGPA